MKKSLVLIILAVVLLTAGCGEMTPEQSQAFWRQMSQNRYENPYDSPYFVEQVRQQHRNAEIINRNLSNK